MILCLSHVLFGMAAFAMPQNHLNDNDISAPVQISSDLKYEADSFDYNDETGLVTLSGFAKIISAAQGINMSADVITYDTKAQLLQAYGHVMFKDFGQVTFSDELKLNMAENKAFLREVATIVPMATIKSESANVLSGVHNYRGSYTNGTFDTNTDIRIYSVSMRSFALQSAREYIPDDGEQSFVLTADNITYTPDRLQNNLYITHPRIKFKESGISLPMPPLLLTAGQSNEQMIIPLLGNVPRTGSGDFNIGPRLSFVLGDPAKKRAFQIAPFAQIGTSLGFGGMLGYTSQKTKAILAYGSHHDRGLAEITHKINPNWRFRYGWNSYMSGGIARHYAELRHQKYLRPSGFKELLQGEAIQSTTSFVLAEDSASLRREEGNRISELQSQLTGNTGNVFAGRLEQRLFARTKPILHLGSDTHYANFAIDFSSMLRYYTTGDHLVLGGISPHVHLHMGDRANAEIGYTMQALNGNSPFGFDQIIEKQLSAYLIGDIVLTKWLSVGINSRYSFSRSEFVSQIVTVSLGPKDFRVLLGFDPVYRRFQVGMNLYFKDPVKYKKLTYHGQKKK